MSETSPQHEPSSTDADVNRFEVAVRWNRPLDHPRDDSEELSRHLRVHFTNSLAAHHDKSAVRVVDVETDPRGRSELVVEIERKARVPPLDAWARSAVKDVVRRRYNASEERSKPALGHQSTHIGNESLAQKALRMDDKPQRHHGSPVRDDEWREAKARAAEHEQLAGDAPQLWPDEVGVRTLESGHTVEGFPGEVGGE